MKKHILKTLAAGPRDNAQEASTSKALPKRAKTSPVLASAEKALRDYAGDNIININPFLVEPSPFRDRMEADADALEKQEELKLSILEEKQKLPVLVRPHPTKPNWYQLAYGHRRLKAVQAIANEAERPESVFLRAHVRPLTDAQLIQEQTIENGVRENLTWIEKALWAEQLKSTGIKQREMTTLLGVSEAEVSRLFKVLQLLPESVIRGVGRAQGVGRPKWLELAEKYSAAPERKAKLEELVSSEQFVALPSADRIEAVMRLLAGRQSKNLVAQKNVAETRVGDQVICSVKSTSNSMQLTIPKNAVGFGRWLAENMERFYGDYSKIEEEKLK